MKIIGLEDKTLQFVFYKLQGKLNLALPEDNRDCEVLVCSGIEHLRESLFTFKKSGHQCKVIIILDYIKELERIEGIQILQDLPPKFIPYVKEKCTYGEPIIRQTKDTLVLDKVKEVQKDTFFTKVIYPFIYNGIKQKDLKKEIVQALVNTIKGVITKDNYYLDKYKPYIKPKYMKILNRWLQTEEAMQVCECLLTKTVKYNFDTFEINYLLNNLNEEESNERTAEDIQSEI